ncbi:hypothetical protein BJY59DRAFT_359755 [Rhodotorula toruloides]
MHAPELRSREGMRIDGGARSGWDGGRQCFKSGLSSPSSLSLLHLTRSFPQPPPLSSPRQPPPPTPPYSSSALLFSLELPRPAPSPSDSSSSASLPRQRRPRRPASRTWASTAAEVSSGRAGWTLSSRRSGGRVDLSTTFHDGQGGRAFVSQLCGQQQHVDRLEDSSAVDVVRPSFAYPFERLGSSPRDSSNASADGSDAGLCFHGPKPWRRRAGRPS